jgi:hypothetical protein
MTRLRGRFGWKEFNSHSVALCPRAVDIADNFVIPDLMLVIDGGYRKIVRCPVAVMIGVRPVLRFGDGLTRSCQLVRLVVSESEC